MNLLRILMMVAVGVVAAGCGTSIPLPELPLIAPPVQAAIPAGLSPGAAPAPGAMAAAMLRPADLQGRFFSGSGPTDLMTLLDSIDHRLAEINRMDPRPACLDQPPVEYAITPFGNTVTMWAQCYRTFETSAAADIGFLQFAEHDGKLSLYVDAGAARFAAIVTPVEGSTEYMVDAWYGVGYSTKGGCGSTGTFEACSQSVTELYANPVTKTFEMSVAGLGVGFCGVQFGSNGAALYGIGSTETGTTCNDPATLCVSAADLGSPGVCGSPPAYILTRLGRKAGAQALAASRYPAEPTITLDGTRTDSLHFGPNLPTAGTGNFDAAPTTGR
jgi:hypothetical protein